ncbi:MAG: ABA4-like family protein [Rhodobacteraceae bacterium]|nr:ABA4-like family protein [Paracoccaceae bacterium]
MLSDPHQMFQITGPLAMLGWLALVLSPLAPRLADWVAALVIPALLSVGYTALILVHWADAPGGFDSLANVMALFTNPAVALAGWVHYLAFDLFVGAWITRTARAEAIPHLLILPCLVLTFLFGPAGLLAFLILRASLTLRARMTGATQ